MRMWKRTALSTLLAASLMLPSIPTAFAATVEEDTKALMEAYQELLLHYSKPDQDQLLEAAIRGMLEAIDDPYTNYMSPTEYQDFEGAVNQTIGGIGINYEVLEGTDVVRVVKVGEGYPAAKAGMKAGDIILKVDGAAAKPGEPDAMMDNLLGKEGTSVTVTVSREGKELVFTMQRVQLQMPLVLGGDMGDGIRYIGIASFGEKTTEEFNQELSRALDARAKGIVLDLRGNGGGYVESALEIADMFLKKGTLLIVHDEDGEEVQLDAEADGTDVPLTVLIDEHTASASEILAGALQKNGRAKLLGVKSYGKGTMQQPFELSNGSVLKVSVENWKLTDGTNVHKKGLLPDIRIQTVEAVPAAAKQTLLSGFTSKLSFHVKERQVAWNGSQSLAGLPAPFELSDQFYVPLRFTAEMFGSQVDWKQGSILFTLNGHQISIKAADQQVLKDGVVLDLHEGDPVAYGSDGSMYLSAEAWSAVSGHDVKVENGIVTVYNK